jgi:hypothetical protein
MPQIIVKTTDSADPGTEVLRERVVPDDVATDTSSALLVERIAWALTDADELERNRSDSYEEHPSDGFNGHQGTVADNRVL